MKTEHYRLAAAAINFGLVFCSTSEGAEYWRGQCNRLDPKRAFIGCGVVAPQTGVDRGCVNNAAKVKEAIAHLQALGEYTLVQRLGRKLRAPGKCGPASEHNMRLLLCIK